eukprot:14204061-Alexandrium_andersonii.AAC.1
MSSLRSILSQAASSHIALEDIISAGLSLGDPEFLRARAADEHEALSQRRITDLTMEVGQRVILEAGQRALLAAPLPTTGGELPLSNDGPDDALLAAAAGQTSPVEPKEEVKEEPKEDDSST